MARTVLTVKKKEVRKKTGSPSKAKRCRVNHRLVERSEIQGKIGKTRGTQTKKNAKFPASGSLLGAPKTGKWNATSPNSNTTMPKKGT